MLRRIVGLIGLSATLLCAGVVGAQAAEDFYKGKRITIIVGFTPGGGYDAYARLMVKHYPKQIPGEPAIVIQNMPAAGSLTAVKYLHTTAPQDGTVMTIFNSGLIAQSLSNPADVDEDFSKLRFVGSATAEVRACYAWNATGIKNIQDVMKRPELVLGATGVGSSAYINGALLRSMLGIKVKQVTGYPGSAEQRLAIERGELDGDCGSWGSIPVDWIRDNKVTPYLTFSRAKAKGMPDLPMIADLVKTEQEKQVLTLVLAASEIGRPFAVGPDVPKDRLEILRKAFDAMVKDKDFLEEADKTGREVLGPMNGEAVEAMIRDIYKAPKEVVARAGEAIK